MTIFGGGSPRRDTLGSCSRNQRAAARACTFPPASRLKTRVEIFRPFLMRPFGSKWGSRRAGRRDAEPPNRQTSRTYVGKEFTPVYRRKEWWRGQSCGHLSLNSVMCSFLFFLIRGVPDWVKNQPWNIKPMTEGPAGAETHGRMTGSYKGKPQFNTVERYVHGTPTWSKVGTGAAVGHPARAAKAKSEKRR